MDCLPRSRYGGVSVELAEWSIATVFELLSVDVFMQLMICVMLERPVAVLCTSPGPRSAAILALMAVLRPWRYAHTVRPAATLFPLLPLNLLPLAHRSLPLRMMVTDAANHPRGSLSDCVGADSVPDWSAGYGLNRGVYRTAGHVSIH